MENLLCTLAAALWLYVMFVALALYFGLLCRGKPPCTLKRCYCRRNNRRLA